MGAGLLRLGSDSGLQAAALAGTLPWAAFAAEVLRHDPPIQNTRRYLADDLVLDGQRLLAGDSLLLVLASAAHDMPAQDRPAQFQLQRPARSPLPLGLGTHACPGGAAALAIAICAWRHILQVDGRGAPDKPDGSASSASLAAVVQHTRGVSWRASANARLPIFTAAAAV